jgi:predicted Zn-dependent protease
MRTDPEAADVAGYSRPMEEKAFRLNPNDPYILVMYGGRLYQMGRAQEGVDLINRSFRLHPYVPDYYYYDVDPFYATGQYEEVIARLRKPPTPFTWSRILLAMSYSRLGRRAEAAAAVAELSRLYPDFSMERALSDFGAIKDQATLAIIWRARARPGSASARRKRSCGNIRR